MYFLEQLGKGSMIVTSKTITFLVGHSSILPLSWKEELTRIWNECVFMLRWREHQQNLAKLCAETGYKFDLAGWRDQPDVVEILESISSIKETQGRFLHPRLEVRPRKADDKWELYHPSEIKVRIDRSKSWDKANLKKVSVWEIPQDRTPWVNPKWLEECPIPVGNTAKITAIDLRKPFAKKRCEWLAESSLPSVYINDFIELVVCAAWNAYAANLRGKPKYKRKGDLITTIASASFRNQCKYLGGDNLKIPGFTQFRVKGLGKEVMEPIAKMVEVMRAKPESFPQIQKKFDDYLIVDRSKLLKADGIDLAKLSKDRPKEEIDALVEQYSAKVDRSGYLDRAIEYFSSPGSFRLVEREGKTYLQVSAFMPCNATPSEKVVGIDTGLALLVDGTNGLRVDHADFSKQEDRLINLDRAISRCQHGSKAWAKLMAKKRKLEGQIKRSKKTRQTYFAAQIADVNGAISVKKIDLPKTVGLPIPRPDGEGGYLPNGAGEARLKNKWVHDCATGQFVLLLKQQAVKRGREFSLVEIEPEATAAEVLEVSGIAENLPPVSAPSECSPSSSATSETVGSNPKEGGKRKRLPRSPKIKKQESPEFVSMAITPEPLNFKPRSRKFEKQIG